MNQDIDKVGELMKEKASLDKKNKKTIENMDNRVIKIKPIRNVQFSIEEN